MDEVDLDVGRCFFVIIRPPAEHVRRLRTAAVWGGGGGW